MPREITRRNVLCGTAASASFAVFGIGSVSASSSIDNITDFEPGDLDEVQKVWEEFCEGDDVKKHKILENIEGLQKEAFLDAGREVYRTNTQELQVGGRVEATGLEVVKTNTQILEKWGWDTPDSMPANPSPLGEPDTASIASDPFCEGDTGEYSDTVTSTSAFGEERYTWEHSIEWDWYYCSDGTGGIYDDEVENGRHSNTVVDTSLAWSFNGVASESDWYEENPEEYHAEKTGHFTHFDGTYDDEFPELHLRGDSIGIGATVSSEIN